MVSMEMIGPLPVLEEMGNGVCVCVSIFYNHQLTASTGSGRIKCCFRDNYDSVR